MLVAHFASCPLFLFFSLEKCHLLMLVGHFICLSHTCKCLLRIMSYHRNLGLVCSLKIFIYRKSNKKKIEELSPNPKLTSFMKMRLVKIENK
jgi:hypothetical protein